MTPLERQERLNRTRLESLVFASEELLRGHAKRAFENRFPTRDWRNGAGVRTALPTLASSLPMYQRKRLRREDASSWDVTLLNPVLLSLLENHQDAAARKLRQATYSVSAVRRLCAHAAGGRIKEKVYVAQRSIIMNAIKALGGNAAEIAKLEVDGAVKPQTATETSPLVAGRAKPTARELTPASSRKQKKKKKNENKVKQTQQQYQVDRSIEYYDYEYYFDYTPAVRNYGGNQNTGCCLFRLPLKVGRCVAAALCMATTACWRLTKVLVVGIIVIVLCVYFIPDLQDSEFVTRILSELQRLGTWIQSELQQLSGSIYDALDPQPPSAPLLRGRMGNNI